MTIRLGAFDLASPLGRGGMGAVWSGIHRDSGEPVAVKVLTTDLARREHFRAAFRAEVRAVAGLDHPRIVRPYDHGVVPEDVAAATRADGGEEGQLVAGAPWLAMPLAAGTLAGGLHGALQSGFGAVRDVLLSMLDALAHAHARGVVHRDLKPANVLRFGAGERWRLADFGIAHAMTGEREGEVERASGTPLYMPPEQIRGRWRDYGPWTDLYALGCVAWELVAGRPPFSGDVEALTRAHLTEPPPPLTAIVPVPAGFERWVARLVEKDPYARPRRAADVAAALLDLGDADGKGVVAPWTPATLTGLTATADGEGHEDALPADGGVVVASSSEPWAVVAGLAMPPLPASFRTTRPAPPLPSAGIGLWGLRTVPLVGRGAEREALWTLLREAAAGTPRLAVLEGPAGAGKSRLAAEIAERAHECGAEVLRAAASGGDDGLAALVEGFFRVERLSPAAAEARILARVGDPSLATALASADGRARRASLRTLLERLGRPVVVVIDDVHASIDALDTATSLLEAAAPLLVVVTARREALDESPAGLAIERVLRDPRAVHVPVTSLPPDDGLALVAQLLGLSGELASRVAERTGGNPLFAVQLVGDWVERGLLDAAPSGFRLRPGASFGVPADLSAVWRSRLDRVVGGDEPSLEVAAALGHDVDGDEWRAACAELGVPVGTEALEALLRVRLATGTAARWAFGHGLLREAIEARSREAGRAVAVHAACARALAARSADPGRIGRHLLAAGDAAAAIDRLDEGGWRRQVAGEYHAAEALFADAARACQEAGLPAADPRWARGLVRRAALARNLGRFDEALATIGEAIARAEAIGAHRYAADAIVSRIGILHARQAGGLDDADAWLDRAEAHARAAGHRHGIARAGLLRGVLASDRRDFARARTVLEDALALSEDDSTSGEIERFLGNLGLQGGDLDDAERWFRAALARYERLGDPSGVANVETALAAVLHVRGRFAEAAGAYRAAYARLAAIGGADRLTPLANLASVLVHAGRDGEARAAAEDALALLRRWPNRMFLGLVHLGLVVTDPERADEHLDLAAGHLDACGYVDVDIAMIADRGAALAQAAGRTDRAGRLRALAEAQWAALGGRPRG